VLDRKAKLAATGPPGSSHLVNHNGSYLSMELFRIYSASDVICCERPFTEISELTLLLSGVKQLAPDEIGGCNGHTAPVWLQ